MKKRRDRLYGFRMGILLSLMLIIMTGGLLGCSDDDDDEAAVVAVVPENAKHVILIVGDGMQLEHERAYNQYATGSYDSGLAHWNFPYKGSCSTWDVTTYNRYAFTAGAATIANSGFDPQDMTSFNAVLGYDPAQGGKLPFPQDMTAAVNSKAALNYYGTKLKLSASDGGAIPATDSASAATALAAGLKTDDGNIAWRTGDPENGRLKTIAEMYRTQKNAAIGVVSTVPFSHATPAAFVSHNKSRNNYKAIAQEIVNSVRPEVVIGGGHPAFNDAEGLSGKNAYQYIDAPEYANLKNSSEYVFAERMSGVDGGTTLLAKADEAVKSGKKLFGLFGGIGGSFEYHAVSDDGTSAIAKGTAENPTLDQVSTAALNVLSRNKNGFFLMIEQGDIDWSNHGNDYKALIGGMWDLDKAVRAVEAFIDKPDDGIDWNNTLVIVTSDHANSFMRIDTSKKMAKGKLPQQSKVSDSTSSGGYASNVSFYYPGAEITYGFDGKGLNSHINEPVTVYARGAYKRFGDMEGKWYPGTKLLDNTHIFKVMFDSLGLSDENRTSAASLGLMVYTLADTSMKILNPALTEEQLANAIANGAATVMKPGLGSGLTPDPKTSGFYYMVTDRGINQDYSGTGDPTRPSGGKTFPLPEFTPTITRVQFNNAGSIVIDKVLPILDSNRNYVTGLSNTIEDDTAYISQTSVTALPYNPNGLDTEDISVLPNGDFLLVEEYGPSVVVVDGSTGIVKMRYIPSSKADLYTGAGYPVKAILPAVLEDRRSNRGFENLALSGDGKTAYAVMQSPLGSNKDDRYKNTRVVRIVRLDVSDPINAAVTGHFVALQSAVADYAKNIAGYTVTNKQTDMKYSAASWLATDRILLLERANGKAKLMETDMSVATNLIGKSYENTLGPEDMTTTGQGLAGLGIVPAAVSEVFSTDELKSLVEQTADKSGTAPTYEVKLEGMAIIDSQTVLLVNDNDFGIADASLQTRVWQVKLKNKLNR